MRIPSKILFNVLIFFLLYNLTGIRISAQNSSIRLIHGWEFVKGDLGGVYEALRTGKSAVLPVWEKVSVPHCFNAFDAVDPNIPYYQGPGWYRCILPLKQFETDNRFILLFEGAGQKTDVYINDVLVGRHRGGYDEFRIDITGEIKKYIEKDPGSEGIPLVVRCDNSRDIEMIPSDLSDFNLYGGLYRYVNLLVVPSLSVENVFIESSPGKKYRTAEISLQSTIYNPAGYDGKAELNYTVIDPLGDTVQQCVLEVDPNEMEIGSYSFEIKKPQMWSVHDPQLYTLNIELESSCGMYSRNEKFGIRDFYFEPHGPFYLNGKRLFLRGTHRHEDHAGTAAAMTEDMILQEMSMMKEMGVNFIRLGHYQQSRIVLDACDSLGILVWEEIPWCRGGLGGEVYKDQARRMLRNMVTQHYNHPSIIIWGLGNENDWPGDFSEFDEEKIRSFMQELNDLSHDLDPVRKTAIRRCDFCADIVDVYSPSIWAGWYRGKFTDYTQVCEEWNEKVDVFLHMEWGASNHSMRHSEDPDIGLENIKTGAGADERSGDFLLTGGEARVSKDGDWSETYACNLIDWHLKEQEKMDWHTGAAYWPFKDFSTPLRPENPVPYMNQKGVVERDFRKKEAYYLFQSYWTEEPMVHIYGHSWPVRWGEKQEKKLVKVYSNCKSVELFLNGESVGIKKRDSQDFPSAGLRWAVEFQEGENQLHAVSREVGALATDTISVIYQVEKWTAPVSFKVKELSREQNVITVEARAFDSRGIFCPDAKNIIRFKLAGDAELVDKLGTSSGSSKIQLYNGRALIKVRLINESAVLSVSSQGMETAFLGINMY